MTGVQTCALPISYSGYGFGLLHQQYASSPAIIAQAFADVKPRIVIAVPLVIEKILRKKVFPVVQTSKMQLLLKMPVISKKVLERIRENVYQAFGGKAYEIIIGGAALNQEVETFLKRIGFPYTVGYGATECAPIICYRDWKTFVQGSCGQAAYGQEVRIDNFDEVTVTAKVARKDKDGKRVKEVVDGKKVTVYDEVQKTIKKDQPSRLHARREMLKVLYSVKTTDGTKKGTKVVALALLEHGGIGDRAGGDDADNAALNEPLCGCGVLYLLADGDLIALCDELADIRLRAVVRHAAHGCAQRGVGHGAVTGRQRKVKLL